MRVIRNKTMRPVRVPLPKGKVLHLGARAEGQIAVHHVDHEPLQKLVASGDVEILGDQETRELRGTARPGAENTHGHHPQNSVKKRGNR